MWAGSASSTWRRPGIPAAAQLRHGPLDDVGPVGVGRVVHHGQVVIGGASYVELDPRGARVERGGERLEGVLQVAADLAGAVAAVADDVGRG